jgi:membrane protease YdiL (CAAX protease family)
MAGLAALAGAAEEIFFRAFVFGILEAYSDTATALTVSAAIFGLAHRPAFGANALAEAVFGGYLAYVYWYTDYNLAVAAVVHALYDFTAVLQTWSSASAELKAAVEKERSELRRHEGDPGVDSFDSLCNGVSE